MFAVVRMSDKYTWVCPWNYIGTILIGSLTSFTDNLPTARMGDPVLPLGAVMMGSPQHFTDGRPTARRIDYMTCKGVQITSSLTTFIL